MPGFYGVSCHKSLDPLRSHLLLPLFLERFVTSGVTRHSFNQSRMYERTVIRGVELESTMCL